jgi:hypothetical protein
VHSPMSAKGQKRTSRLKVKQPLDHALWEEFSERQDQGASKPFDFITANDVGDEINDANAFAASS